MVKPQQPELRRSEYGATSDDSIKGNLTAPHIPTERGIGGPVPEDNLPGHHPEHDQDKPDGAAFVEKMHRLAEEEQEQDEAVDVQADADEQPSERAERLAKVASTPFRVASDALQKVRDKL